MQRRREFIQTGVAAAGTLAFGAEFWREALAATVRPAPGPYGPLGAADSNGLRLPTGFRSRLVARAQLPVSGTTYPWHIFPDGEATYPTRDGGWILVSNCEAPASIGGGAGAIRFDCNGRIKSAYRILANTNVKAVLFNIFGGITRCDEVARGLIEAFAQIKPSVPFVVRLDGTNDVEGRELLAEAALPNVHTEATMLGAAQKVVELAG